MAMMVMMLLISMTSMTTTPFIINNTSPPKRLSSPIASPPSSPLLDPLGFANSSRSSSSTNYVFKQLELFLCFSFRRSSSRRGSTIGIPSSPRFWEFTVWKERDPYSCLLQCVSHKFLIYPKKLRNCQTILLLAFVLFPQLLDQLLARSREDI